MIVEAWILCPKTCTLCPKTGFEYLNWTESLFCLGLSVSSPHAHVYVIVRPFLCDPCPSWGIEPLVDNTKMARVLGVKIHWRDTISGQEALREHASFTTWMERSLLVLPDHHDCRRIASYLLLCWKQDENILYIRETFMFAVEALLFKEQQSRW